MNAIWTLKMNSRPFHEWYQEWSTYASRSGANDATKMYAFRQALPAALNDKLVGVSPAPTTFDDLVEKTRLFDQQWQLWRNTHGPSIHRRTPAARARGATTNDPSINLADTNNPSPKRGKLSKEERERRFKAGHCLYCDKKGHYAKECRARPLNQQSGRSRFPPPARTRATTTGEEAPPDEPNDTENAAAIARVYQDPEFNFLAPDSQPADDAADF
jgi:hypothetical protein